MDIEILKFFGLELESFDSDPIRLKTNPRWLACSHHNIVIDKFLMHLFILQQHNELVNLYSSQHATFS